jgi:hypothetical protein
MNKKGLMEAMLNFYRLLFLIVVFLSIVFLVRGFITENVETFEIETKLLTYRAFMSNDSLYVDDELGRTYFGVIDLQKFNSDDFEANIMDSIYYGRDNREASARFVLKDIKEGTQMVKYYNKELYLEKKVIVEAGLTGIGSATTTFTPFYVIIKNGEKKTRGVLIIDAILPNS